MSRVSCNEIRLFSYHERIRVLHILGNNVIKKAWREAGIIMIRISEFQLKDVVNVSDGRKLGNIGDIDINLDTGKIESIIISQTGKLLGFFSKDDEIIIPWNQIIKIGTDVILVRHSGIEHEQQQLGMPKD